MSIARDNVASLDQTIGSSLSWNHDYTGDANGIVFIGLLGNSGVDENHTISVLYGTLPCQRMDLRHGTVGGGFWLEVWGVLNPPVGVQAITVTFDVESTYEGISVSYSGATQTPVLDIQTYGESATHTVSVDVPTVLANCWMVAFVDTQQIDSMPGFTTLTETTLLNVCDSSGPVAAGAHTVAATAFTLGIAETVLAFEPADGGAKGIINNIW